MTTATTDFEAIARRVEQRTEQYDQHVEALLAAVDGQCTGSLAGLSEPRNLVKVCMPMWELIDYIEDCADIYRKVYGCEWANPSMPFRELVHYLTRAFGVDLNIIEEHELFNRLANLVEAEVLVFDAGEGYSPDHVRYFPLRHAYSYAIARKES